MRLLSPRLLVPLAVVVIAWGGVRLLGSHTLAVNPAVWPVAGPAASGTPGAAAVAPPAASPAPLPSPSAGIPVLPGAMKQLNSSTRDTAVGLYALVQQLGEAMRTRLEDLVRQLEPGR